MRMLLGKRESVAAQSGSAQCFVSGHAFRHVAINLKSEAALAAAYCGKRNAAPEGAIDGGLFRHASRSPIRNLPMRRLQPRIHEAQAAAFNNSYD